MNSGQFGQIFQADENIFERWAGEKKENIDALELFSGLIIFSDARFDEKIRFLFDLFDFNELNSLSLVDIEFMLISCCNASQKIIGRTEVINEDEICQFLANYFNEESRVNISQLLKWCYQNQMVDDFFTSIDKPIPDFKKKKKSNQLIRTVYENQIQNDQFFMNDRVSQIKFKESGDIMNSRQYQQKLDWISQLSKKIFLPQQSNKENKDIRVKMNWVYGFRCQDVKKAFIMVPEQNKIVYFTACICIVYLRTTNQQHHYQLHKHEIISITLSENKQFIASGELAEQPEIHVWDINNYQNKTIIKGHHRNGVHLMSFFKSDEMLATCSIKQDSTVLVYRLSDSSLLLSTYVNGLAIDMFGINNHIGINDYSVQQYNTYVYLNSCMIVLTYSEIYLLYFTSQQNLVKKSIKIYKSGIHSKIKQGISFRSNSNSISQCNDQDSSIRIVTGHKNGQLVVWEEQDNQLEFSSVLKSYNQEVLGLLDCYEMLVVITDVGWCYFWNLDLNQELRKLDLTNCTNNRLFNMTVCDIEAGINELMICTTDGDLMSINLEIVRSNTTNQPQIYSQSDLNTSTQFNTSQSDLIFQRLNFITKLSGHLKAISFLEKNINDRILYLGGQSNNIYAFAFDNHELIDIWSIGENISAIDSYTFENGSTHFSVGCESGKLYIRQDWEEYPSIYEISKYIHDIKFKSDGNSMIVVSEDGFAYVFKFCDNSFFKIPPLKIRFDNEIPISITFTDDNQSFIIGTSQKNLYKIDQNDNKSKNLLLENELINCTIWNIYYPVSNNGHSDTKTQTLNSSQNNGQNQSNLQSNQQQNYKEQYLPFIIGGEIKLFVGSDNNGFVYFYKDREQLEMNCGGFLKGHSSVVSRLAMTREQDLFYSLGREDQTLIEWKIEEVNQMTTQQQLKTNDYSQYQQQFRQQFQSKSNANNINIDSNDNQIGYSEQSLQMLDEALYRELQFCQIGQFNNPEQQFKDSLVVLKGTNQNSQINSQNQIDMILQTKGIKDNQIVYENNQRYRRPPPLSIELDHVYGFQCYDQRDTLQYIHRYEQADWEKEYNNDNNRLLKNYQYYDYQYLEALEQNQQVALQKYEYWDQEVVKMNRQKHIDCEREIIYFTGRIMVIYNPNTKQQSFYQNHKQKVTCFTVHPDKETIASGESSIHPIIHIWSIKNHKQPIELINTYHKNGILKMAFSKDKEGKYLVSVGNDKYFSVQVMDWRRAEVVGIRNTGVEPIFDVGFDPYCKTRFVTAGYQNVTFWDIEYRNVIRNKIVKCVDQNQGYSNEQCGSNQKAQIISVIQYLSYNLQSFVQSDLICGTNGGDICLISHKGEYQPMRQLAHPHKLINCIKVVDVNDIKIVIITAGEDECIRIWDSRFEILHCIVMKKIPELSGIDQSRNLSVQSIDIYMCTLNHNKVNPKSNSKQNNDDNWMLLVGTRNGDIIEVKMNILYQNKQHKPQKQQQLIEPQYNLTSESSESEMDEYELQMKRKKKLLDDRIISSFKFEYYLEQSFHQQQNKNEILQQLQPQNNSKKVVISVHPHEPVLFSTGEDKLMVVWDLKTNQPIYQKRLDAISSCIQFSPDGNLLIVGFYNGSFKIIDTKSIHSNGDTNRQMSEVVKGIDFETGLQNVKGDKNSVINIQFSNQGSKMAVSYYHSYSTHNQSKSSRPQNSLEPDQPYIHIFYNLSKSQSLQPNIVNTQGSKMLFQKCEEQIRISDINENIIHQSNRECSKAVHSMCFSECDDYLLVYYQNIDNQLIRMNYDNNGQYMMWDVRNVCNNQVMSVKNWSILSDIKFPCLDISNSINGFYQYTNHKLQNYMRKDRNKNNSSINNQMVSEPNNPRNMDNNSLNNNNNNNITNSGSPNTGFNQQINHSESAQLVNQTDNTQNLKITNMIVLVNQQFIYDEEIYVIMGSIYGDIHMARYQALSNAIHFPSNQESIQQQISQHPPNLSQHSQNNNPENKEDPLKQQIDHKSSNNQYFLAKSYSAHSSFINQIVNYKNQYLLSTGISDECILKWKLTIESIDQDIDYKNYDINEYDLFSEIKPIDKFVNEVDNILNIRNDIYEIKEQVDDTNHPEYELVLQNIIGRKSFNSRNNLFYCYDNRIIYISGSNLVLTDFQQAVLENVQTQYSEETKDNINNTNNGKTKDSQNANMNQSSINNIQSLNPLVQQNMNQNDSDIEYLNQEFINVDIDDLKSSQPEIQCLQLSKDRKLMAVGTNQLQCKLIVWDIHGRNCLLNIQFPICIFISHARFSDSNKRIGLLAVTEDYKQILYLIDIQQSCILAQSRFEYSSVFRYRDICFSSDSMSELILCGNRVIQVWEYKATIFQYYNIDLQVESMKNNRTHQKSLKWTNDEIINFMGLVSIENWIIIAADDGYLYICDHHKVISRQLAHPNNYILTIYNSRLDPFIVTGATDGKVVLWQLLIQQPNPPSLKQLQVYDLFDNKENKVLNSNCHIQSLCIGQWILCGTKSGDIYELQIPNSTQLKQSNTAQLQIKQKMKAHDGDHVKAIQFQNNDDKIFTITENGFLCIIDITNLQRIYQKNFNRNTINLIVCKKSNRIFICFKDEIIVLKNERDYPKDQYQNLQIKNNQCITEMKLSYQEKILAIALKNNSKNSSQNSRPRIDIYDVEKEDENFIHICYIDDLVNSIENIDISLDDQFLMFKDTEQEVVYLNLDNFTKENSIAIEYDIQWANDAIKYSDQVRGIEQYYQYENNSLKVIQISQKTIAVTDEMGTIRLFKYPYQTQSQGFMQCYTNHLNFIDLACLSNQKKYLITYSLTDRCMMLWRIENNECKRNPIKDIAEFE